MSTQAYDIVKLARSNKRGWTISRTCAGIF